MRIAPPDLRPRTATVRAPLIIPRYQAVDAALYQTARAFRYAGTALEVLARFWTLNRSSPPVTPAPIHRRGFGLGDGADRRARQALWVPPPAALSSQSIGTAVGGLVFGIGGGIAGDWAGEKACAAVYDWVADTQFTSLMSMPVPNDMLDVIPQ